MKFYSIYIFLLISISLLVGTEPDWYTNPPTSLYFDFIPAEGSANNIETARRIAEDNLMRKIQLKDGFTIKTAYTQTRTLSNRDINEFSKFDAKTTTNINIAVSTYECINGEIRYYLLGYRRKPNALRLPSMVKESFLGSVFLPGYGAFRYSTPETEGATIIGLTSALGFYPTFIRGIYEYQHGRERTANYWFYTAGGLYVINLVTSYIVGINREKTPNELFPELGNRGARWKAPALNAVLPGTGTLMYGNSKTGGATAFGIISSSCFYFSLASYASYKSGNYDLLGNSKVLEQEKDKFYIYTLAGFYGFNIISGAISGDSYQYYKPKPCKYGESFFDKPVVGSTMWSFLPGAATIKYGKWNLPTVVSALSALGFYSSVIYYILDRTDTWHIGSATPKERAKYSQLAIYLSGGLHLLSGPLMGMSYSRKPRKEIKRPEPQRYRGRSKAFQGFVLGVLLPGSALSLASKDNPYTNLEAFAAIGFYSAGIGYLYDYFSKGNFFSEKDRRKYENWQKLELYTVAGSYAINVISSIAIGASEYGTQNYARLNDNSSIDLVLLPYLTMKRGENNVKEARIVAIITF